MGARAETTEATRQRILEAVEAAFDELAFDEITLARIAKRANVSVQTILRHFESKEALRAAALLHAGQKMAATRTVMPVGDLDEIVDVLVDTYEQFGNRVLRMLAREEEEAALRQLADLGRAYHLEWCKQAFSASLKGLRGQVRERRIAQIVACTDVYVWRVLRRDRGLSPRQAKLAMLEMLEPLTLPRRGTPPTRKH
jgi:AcrR family transcriptional regulator